MRAEPVVDCTLHVCIAGRDPEEGLGFVRLHVGIAGDVHRTDAVLRAPADREDDLLFALVAAPRILRRRVAITLPLQVRFDPSIGVLEQVFIGGTFPLDRHEVIALLRWERIALEDHLKMRAGIDGHGHAGRLVILADGGRVFDAGFVVPAMAQLVAVLGESGNQGRTLVRLPLLRA